MSLKLIHIPNTGSSMIEEIAIKNGIAWGKFDKSGLTSQNLPPDKCSPWERLPTKRSQTIYTFCIVRNPLDRALTQISRENSLRDICYTNNEVNEILGSCDRLTNYSMSCHWIPQYKYSSFCDHVLKYEDLKSEMESLMKNYDINVEFDVDHLKYLDAKNPNCAKVETSWILPHTLKKFKHCNAEDVDMWEHYKNLKPELDDVHPKNIERNDA
eukprot:CAMPEP_0167742988 /NCGR_PEP_ID=MMETSP0110_2-20121227/1755_1 /TAXON_ID=629695 /ORGANISM="Gymnochlora sp., Strain CCMP2014" /LENGTH=212 /DNA_ID=CAMNT_0007627287 /DNA_START=297 /DNA_END=935 /DNA_ORIENTATION=+